MSEFYVTSDTHWAHTNIIKYSNRPFADVEEMNQALVKNINDVVGADDWLFHLGDWSFGGIDNVKKYRDQINCKNIVLVLGNHDQHIQKSPDLQKLFTEVHPSYLERKINGQEITFCHYAMRVFNKSHRGAWNLYAHSHGSLPDDPTALAFDVGVDCWDYKPLHFDQVKEIMSRKTYQPIDHHGKKD